MNKYKSIFMMPNQKKKEKKTHTKPLSSLLSHSTEMRLSK